VPRITVMQPLNQVLFRNVIYFLHSFVESVFFTAIWWNENVEVGDLVAARLLEGASIDASPFTLESTTKLCRPKSLSLYSLPGVWFI